MLILAQIREQCQSANRAQLEPQQPLMVTCDIIVIDFLYSPESFQI